MVRTADIKSVKESVYFTPRSGAPTAQEGKVYYDSGAKVLKYYDGVSWRPLSSGGFVVPLSFEANQIAGVTSNAAVNLPKSAGFIVPLININGSSGMTAGRSHKIGNVDSGTPITYNWPNFSGFGGTMIWGPTIALSDLTTPEIKVVASYYDPGWWLKDDITISGGNFYEDVDVYDASNLSRGSEITIKYKLADDIGDPESNFTTWGTELSSGEYDTVDEVNGTGHLQSPANTSTDVATWVMKYDLSGKSLKTRFMPFVQPAIRGREDFGLTEADMYFWNFTTTTWDKVCDPMISYSSWYPGVDLTLEDGGITNGILNDIGTSDYISGGDIIYVKIVYRDGRYTTRALLRYCGVVNCYKLSGAYFYNFENILIPDESQSEWDYYDNMPTSGTPDAGKWSYTDYGNQTESWDYTADGVYTESTPTASIVTQSKVTAEDVVEGYNYTFLVRHKTHFAGSGTAQARMGEETYGLIKDYGNIRPLGSITMLYYYIDKGDGTCDVYYLDSYTSGQYTKTNIPWVSGKIRPYWYINHNPGNGSQHTSILVYKSKTLKGGGI